MKRTECGFVRPDNAPTEEAARALPTDVSHMRRRKVKSVLYGGMTKVPTTQVKTHQYFGGRNRSSRREKVGRLWSLSLSRRKMATWHSAV